MNRLLRIAVIFLVVLQVSDMKAARANRDEDDYRKHCRTNSTCGGIDIKYPFRLKSSPRYCGAQGLEVSCSSSGGAVLTLPNFGSFKLINIDYEHLCFTIKLGESWARCPLQQLISANFTNTVNEYTYLEMNFTVVTCSREIQTDPDWITGPISCLGTEEDHLVYVAKDWESMDMLPHGCQTTNNSGVIPGDYLYTETWAEVVQSFIQTRELNLYLNMPEMDACRDCRNDCGFSQERNQTFCISSRHGPSFTLIASTSAALFLIAVVAAFFLLIFILRKSEIDQETRLKVEKFLATYDDAKPTRYTFSDIKKITKRFKDKLGQGGYGSVYRGMLPNGIPVAVKMLERSKGEGEEFINEVATIGRIHHMNIVRLLGFCSETSTRALVYEFLPNESLEKYIFSGQEDKRALIMEKLLDIVIGIARGIEYLHQGCQQRILHFDIKPHNILLDHEFKPKISDFGLAKLCSKEQSIVTMTAARGTMGYIAPEMYSRNFGTVSYKSDIYSFGMLMLEMVGGRKNLDPEIGKQSEIYYPEWIYDRLVRHHDLGLATEVRGGEEEEEEETVKKLAIVALWCIQWSPMDRPSMSKVLQMLITDLQSLQMPPKPFVSSSVDRAN